jgi:light-regulated signal transduction histidine kinase (bacteriophytochrome)
MIITDSAGHPVNWNNLPLDGWSGKLLPPKSLNQLTNEEIGWLYQRRQAMDEVNEPLPLLAEGEPFGALHYGQTPVVRILRWTPLVELFITGLFCFIGYFGFHIIRSNEQSMLWVGLAKETAHQMGTPISSLLGWIDLLKMRLDDAPQREKSLRIVGEMESDLARLNRVATRFSKIGSLPELKRTDLNEIVRFTAKYYQARLPHLGKRIRIDLELGEIPSILLNGELIGWVIENLLRNAVDSIEAEEGIITITSSFAEAEGTAHLTVEDNGKGIPREHVRHIFSPGFTTKKRGWGLGLSLCRRIVEEYHEGHIFVAHSVMDDGTRFEVSLPQTPVRSTRKAG